MFSSKSFKKSVLTAGLTFASILSLSSCSMFSYYLRAPIEKKIEIPRNEQELIANIEYFNSLKNGLLSNHYKNFNPFNENMGYCQKLVETQNLNKHHRITGLIKDKNGSYYKVHANLLETQTGSGITISEELYSTSRKEKFQVITRNYPELEKVELKDSIEFILTSELDEEMKFASRIENIASQELTQTFLKEQAQACRLLLEPKSHSVETI